MWFCNDCVTRIYAIDPRGRCTLRGCAAEHVVAFDASLHDPVADGEITTPSKPPATQVCDVLEIALLRGQSPIRQWHFQSNERIRIGRDVGDSSSIHVPIPFKFASRRHATVELRSRQLIVMDTSTNGTFQIDTSCRLPQGSEEHFSLEVPVTLRLGHKLDGRDLQFSLIQELAGPIPLLEFA